MIKKIDEASQKTYIKIQELIYEGAVYFDPLSKEDNSIGSWYYREVL